MTSKKITQRYEVNWDEIIESCDFNRDGVIDFQEFMQASIDRKVLTNSQDVSVAFKILDTNKDGRISLDDFDNMFNTHGGTKMDTQVWNTLLQEADMNGDGVVSFEEFQQAMGNLLRKGLKKKAKEFGL